MFANCRFWSAFAFASFVAFMPALLMGAEKGSQAGGKLWVYIGTYTGSGSQGIYRAELDPATGTLGNLVLAGTADNPSFLALHPHGILLYSAGEVWGPGGQSGGPISAWTIQPKTGKLTLLNHQSSGGSGPCHVAVDPAGKYVLAANYGGGSVVCLPVQGDGQLGAASAFIQHQGSGLASDRQGGPHAHCATLAPNGRYVFVADLGLDKIMSYRLDSHTGKLTPNTPAWFATAPGAGPRHFAFHPNGHFAYAINELNNTITAMKYDAARGALAMIQNIGTLPADFDRKNSTAEIVVHPSGKFLYGSNRGHDSIAIFSIARDSGKLTALGHEPTQGKMPRSFTIDPTGRFLLAANQEGNNVVAFRIDAKTGKLTATGSSLKVAAPVCVLFANPFE